ncbi:hypothetical protein NMY22_g11393 [Coprinellus aureogranulatus]|nr:hypothetical protein NMY22_g11393 [Coprinellus aureogranulatus]
MSIQDSGHLMFRMLELSKLANCFTIAGITIVVADYAHTLPEEVELIWPTRLSLPKLIFLSVRYGNFMITVIEFLYTFIPIFSSKGCRATMTGITVYDIIQSSLGEGEPNYSEIEYWTNIDVPFCARSNNISQGVRVLRERSKNTLSPRGRLRSFQCPRDGICGEVASVYRRVSGLSYTQHGGGLLAQFYHTGFGYFLALIALNAVNILVNFFGPVGARYMLTRFQFHLHGVIVTRVILHLRAYSEQARFRTITLGSVDFNSGDQSAMAGFSIAGNAEAKRRWWKRGPSSDYSRRRAGDSEISEVSTSP